MQNDEKNSLDSAHAHSPGPRGSLVRSFSQSGPGIRRIETSTRQALDTPSEAGEFARHQIAVDHSLVGAAHQFGLSPTIRGDRFVPLTARDSRFHPAQERSNSRNPRPIDLGTPFRLSKALLGGNVLGHHRTFRRCASVAVDLVIAAPRYVNRMAMPDRKRAHDPVRIAAAPEPGVGGVPRRSEAEPSGCGTAACASPRTPPSLPSDPRWRTPRGTSVARSESPRRAWSRRRD